jgi:hypothetical protein
MEFVLDHPVLGSARSDAQEEGVTIAKEPVFPGNLGLGGLTGAGAQLEPWEVLRGGIWVGFGAGFRGVEMVMGG